MQVPEKREDYQTVIFVTSLRDDDKGHCIL